MVGNPGLHDWRHLQRLVVRASMFEKCDQKIEPTDYAILLTSMSIHDEIRDARNGGGLIVMTSPIPSDSVGRTLLVAPEIAEFVNGPWTDPEQSIRGIRLHADFDRFASGDPLVITLHAYRMKGAFMGRLAPAQDSIWDIRSVAPRPAIRVLGAFADTDIFVALTLFNRKHLLGKREWDNAINITKHHWHGLFPAYEPHRGDNPRDFISTNVTSLGS